MKNIIKLFAILAMCFMVVCALAACNKEQPAVDNDNSNNQTTVSPELYIKDGTYWVGDFNTGLSAEGRAELCPNGQHEWHDMHIIQAHTQDGTPEIMFYGCLDCNYATTVETGHVYEKVETVAATCTDIGYELYECRCGLTEKRSKVDALGHDFPTWNTTWTYKTVDTTVWTALTTITADNCPCEFVGKYDAKCTRCDARTEAKETAKIEHSYTKFYPAVPDATLSPCLQATYEIAKCDNCNHAENIAEHEKCVNHAFYKKVADEPGHIYTEWTLADSKPTEDAGAAIVRSCTRPGCNTKATDPAFNSTLPALSKDNGWTLVVKEPSCVEAGVKTYTMTKDTTPFEYTVDMGTNGGHKIGTAAAVLTKAPTTDEAGEATVECPDCKAKLTYVLPALPTAEAYDNGKGATNGYDVVPGTCADPTVTFKLTLAGQNSEGEQIFADNSVVIEHKITDQAYHPHAVSTNILDCIKAKDKDGVESWFGLCQNSDGCHQWIYLGPVEE